MPRAREFDEKQVLDAARDVFWEKGFEGATTRDLTAAMGLTTASLYNAFGDKRSLFLATLDHYLDASLRERIARLEATLPPAEAISEFFAETIRRSVEDAKHRGCLLVNSALEARHDDPQMQSVIASETVAMEAFFARSIEASAGADASGAIASTAEASRLLLSVALGLRVLARVRPDRALLHDVVRPVLALLGLPAMKAAEP